MKHCACAFSIIFVLSGCATPQPVLDLADKSAANVGIVGARLRQLSEESTALYTRRAESIARLHGANAGHRANLAYDIALTKRVGQQADLDLIKDMEAWAKEVGDIFAAASGTEKQRREELLAGQTRIDTKSQALQKVAETLSALAQEETLQERVRLLGRFAAEVRDHMKAELDKGTETARAANDLLDKLGVELKPATQQ